MPAERRAIVPTPTTVQLVFNTVAARPRHRGCGRPSPRPGPPAIAQDLTGRLVRRRRCRDLAGAVAVASGRTRTRPWPRRPSSGPTTAAADALAAAGYRRDGLYASRDGAVLRLTLGYPSGNPRLAAAARTIQRQLGLIGIEIDLLADTSSALIENRVAAGTVDLALLTLPRGHLGHGVGRLGVRLSGQRSAGHRLNGDPRPDLVPRVLAPRVDAHRVEAHRVKRPPSQGPPSRRQARRRPRRPARRRRHREPATCPDTATRRHNSSWCRRSAGQVTCRTPTRSSGPNCRYSPSSNRCPSSPCPSPCVACWTVRTRAGCGPGR